VVPHKTISETLKDMVLLILVLIGGFLFLVFLVFLELLMFFQNIELALGVTCVLINPFLIFEIFGWIEIGVWLVIWFIIAVVSARYISVVSIT